MKPIPVQMLRQDVVLLVPTALNEFHEPENDRYYLHRVCLQKASQTVKNRDNTTVNGNALLLVDARLSYPHIDLMQMKAVADSAGGDLRVVYDGTIYTVTNVQELMDDHARLHHYEVTML